MSSTDHADDFIDVGKMGELSEKRTVCVSFHNFAGLPQQLGDKTISPPFSCHGYSWKIVLFPGGSIQSPNDKTRISVYLYVILPENESSLQVKYTLRVGSEALTTDSKLTDSWDEKFTDQCYWGWGGIVLREDVLDKSKGFLDEHGSFRIFADIQVYRNKPHTWTPRKSLHIDMQRLLESGKGADAVFDIDGNKFSVHSNILSQRAPTLAELVEGANNSNIPLPGVDPDMFRLLLHFIYTDDIPPDIDFRAMLELANRLGCSRLKLVAESKLVEKGINTDNAADLLLLADSNSCALLREAAIEYISANTQVVIDSHGWKKVEESAELMSEVIRVCFSRKRPASAISGMGVAQLRQKLEDKGFDVDGTREMLIDRVEKAEASAKSK